MKLSKLVVCLGASVLAVASAAPGNSTYNVTLYEKSVIGNTELKPGEYKVEVNGNKATIKVGKETVEVPVKVEETPSKNSTTSVRYATATGKNKVDEIRLGGTKTKLVFGGSGSASAPAN